MWTYVDYVGYVSYVSYVSSAGYVGYVDWAMWAMPAMSAGCVASRQVAGSPERSNQVSNIHFHFDARCHDSPFDTKRKCHDTPSDNLGQAI